MSYPVDSDADLVDLAMASYCITDVAQARSHAEASFAKHDACQYKS